MSVFVAVELSHVVREAVERVIDGHRAITAKWQRGEKLHLTLVFLGNPTAEQVSSFTPRIDELASRHAPFSLQVEGAGRFETMRAPTVLWLGVGGALEPLRQLQAALATALGVVATQPYVPHITLARAQDAHAFDAAMPALEQVKSESFLVEHVTLFESTHHQYRALHRSALGHTN